MLFARLFAPESRKDKFGLIKRAEFRALPDLGLFKLEANHLDVEAPLSLDFLTLQRVNETNASHAYHFAPCQDCARTGL